MWSWLRRLLGGPQFVPRAPTDKSPRGAYSGLRPLAFSSSRYSMLPSVPSAVRRSSSDLPYRASSVFYVGLRPVSGPGVGLLWRTPCRQGGRRVEEFDVSEYPRRASRAADRTHHQTAGRAKTLSGWNAPVPRGAHGG